MNQSAIDRGLFRSSFFRTYVEVEKSKGAGDTASVSTEEFGKPSRDCTTGMKSGAYNTVGKLGVCA